MTGIKKLVALLMVVAISVSIFAIGTVAVSAEDTAVESVGAGEATGITVHYKSEDTTPYIYYWNSLPENIVTEYPGVAMTKDTTLGNNWYTYEFKDVTKINLIFTDKGGKQLSKEQTRKTGEWWFYNGIWRNSNPDNADPVSSLDPREDTIYFAMTTRFYDGDSSNNVHCWDDGKAGNPDSDPAWRGDFKGLAEKLDYIKALGFSAVWITPIVENASGYDYHGYHAMDFSKVDPRYESEDFTFQDLVDAAHSKGMKIVQDVVWQHTGNFGEATLCPLFTKDYSADQSNIEESMIPTDYLLDTFGLDSADDYWAQQPGVQYQQRLNIMKNLEYSSQQGNSTGIHPSTKDYDMLKVSSSDKYNKDNYYHSGYFQSMNWDDWACKFCQIAGDCVDLNTENPAVAEYVVQSYGNFINMGVDGFRVDTVRHIPRLALNLMFNQQLLDIARGTGKSNFLMFGEICTRFTDVWYRSHAEESSPYYTWKESNSKWASQWSWGSTPEDINNNMNVVFDHYNEEDDCSDEPTSTNAFLEGIDYHQPDRSMASGMEAIDFQMHRLFGNAGSAFGIAKSGDKYYNDATYNVMYVDSHDYSPESPDEKNRFAGGTQTWAENMNLMFTFRGIPCIYYGSEVEFQKGAVIDVGPNAPLASTGRAYFGDYLEGDVNASDFGVYSASGTVSDTLNSPLSKHLSKLNRVRRAIPALQKGQYSVNSNYVSGNMAYIRRYTDDSTDSLALVSISNGATFKNIPNGTYIDAITGDVKNVTNGTLSVEALGQGNMRVYVCCADGFTGIDGPIGDTGLTYLK